MPDCCSQIRIKYDGMTVAQGGAPIAGQLKFEPIGKYSPQNQVPVETCIDDCCDSFLFPP